MQLPHALAPAAEMVPTLHAVHTAELGPPVTVVYVPAAQLRHAVCPVLTAYWPTPQLVHALVPAPE